MSENNGIMPASLADRDLYCEQWVDKTVEEIKKHKYLNPLFDAAFKAFLSDEQALKSFLNGVFNDDRNKIESVVIKNPEINIVFPVVKPFRLDIRAKTSNGIRPILVTCLRILLTKSVPSVKSIATKFLPPTLSGFAISLCPSKKRTVATGRFVTRRA